MAKLMPGRVRNEGIELFEKDLITIHQVSETQLDTTVDQHHLIYALNDSEITCDCDYFAQKGYCPHLAAVEYYLKNDKEGQRLLAELEEEQVEDLFRVIKQEFNEEEEENDAAQTPTVSDDAQ